MKDFSQPDPKALEPRFQGEPSSLMLFDYWMIVLKYWKLIFFVTLAIVLLNTIRVYRLKHVYYASAAIEVQPERLAVGEKAYKPNFSYTAESFVNTQMEVAQSKAVAEMVVQRLGNERSAQLAGLPATNQGHGWSMETLTDSLLRTVRAELQKETFIIRIGAESTSPQSAAELANIWAGTLIDFNQESELLSNQSASAALLEQMERMKKSISEKEKQLAQLAGSASIQVVIPQVDIAGQKFSGLSYQLIQVQNEIAEKQANIRRLEGSDPETLPEVLSSSTVQPVYQACKQAEQEYAEKSKIYKPEFPGMSQLQTKREESCGRFKTEAARMYNSLLQQARSALDSSRARAGALQAELNATKPANSDMNPKSSEYVTLKSDIENERKLLEELTQQRQTAQLSTGGIQMNSMMRIIDRASIPKVSFRPRRMQSIALSMVLGGLFSIGLAFLFHFMNVRVHSHEDIERLTDFRFLTFIPELQKKDGERINQNAFQFLAKIISSREVEGHVPRVILVTSVEPGEGKSYVASNLAMAEAFRGRKVLIMDIDIHRPNVHHVFKVPKSPGLTELLKQDTQSDFEEYSKLYKHLTVVPSGHTNNQQLPVILEDGRFGEIIKRARSEFDTVILDAGPILITPETLSAAGHADGILLVVRSNRTPIRGLTMTEHLLKNTTVPVIGVVLNRVRVRDRSSYYYYFRSYYSYVAGQDAARRS